MFSPESRHLPFHPWFNQNSLGVYCMLLFKNIAGTVYFQVSRTSSVKRIFHVLVFYAAPAPGVVVYRGVLCTQWNASSSTVLSLYCKCIARACVPIVCLGMQSLIPPGRKGGGVGAMKLLLTNPLSLFLKNS